MKKNKLYYRSIILQQTSLALLFFFFLLPSFGFCQTEELNQLDKNGKKQGKWIEYLSDKWKAVTDSSQALYYKYVYYEHGQYILSRFNNSGVNERLEYTGNHPAEKNKLNLLDGEYKWYDKKGRLLTDEVYTNGECIWDKSYKNGKQLEQYDDYSRKYMEQPHTYYIESYDKNGNVTYCYMRDGKEGWAAYAFRK